MEKSLKAAAYGLASCEFRLTHKDSEEHFTVRLKKNPNGYGLHSSVLEKETNLLAQYCGSSSEWKTNDLSRSNIPT